MEKMIELSEVELDAVAGGVTESTSFTNTISGTPGTNVGIGGAANLTSTPTSGTSSAIFFEFISIPAT
jgi:hypothetical protein